MSQRSSAGACTGFLNAILCLGILSGCGGDGTSATDSAPRSLGTVKVLSNRADLISGGDALVEVVPAAGVDVSTLKLDVGGTDVTESVAMRANGRIMGVVAGLAKGSNILTARLADGSTASVTITSHSSSGPILYGPQVLPWACDAGATDTNCNRPTSYSYKYMSSNPALTGFLPYDPNSPATDVATTTNDQGKAVPFIVRVETGVLDRDYYNIAVLFDTTRPWQPWAPQPGWNGKVVYTHGAGFGMGYGQLNSVSGPSVLNSYALSKGFAVMSTALNDTGHNGNIAIQAEAMMMLREHFIETYGEIRYSIGVGGSGGALAQQWVANAYPGLYSGLIVDHSFPDAGSTAIETEDCALLRGYFSDASKWGTAVTWAHADQLAASGQVGDVCTSWVAQPSQLGLNVDFGFPQLWDPTQHGVVAFPGISPTAFGGCSAPIEATYNPTFNPTGVRCDAQDFLVGIMGRRSTDGFANRPYANVGVQYGLTALNAGTITSAQFVDLNSKVGAHTIDYAFQGIRTRADAPAVASSYRSGWINSANGLSAVAILDSRSPDTASIHHQVRSWVMRARLDKAQGHHRNQVIWYNVGKPASQALDAMDSWLAAVEADNSAQSLAQKIVSDRPASLIDQCGDVDGTSLTMLQCTGVPDGTTRMAAGAPIADDVLDCKLVALDRTKYAVAFTDAQWATLQAVFPTGVCDYTLAGEGQQSTLPWPGYLNADGSVLYGGAPLPPAP